MAMKDQQMQELVASQQESQKLLAEMSSLMAQQLEATKASQQLLIQLVDGQKCICKVLQGQSMGQEFQKKDVEGILQNNEKQLGQLQKLSEEVQQVRENTESISQKTHAMEYRQWLGSSEYKDSLRGLDQFSRGDLWSLSNAQCRGVQSALEVGCASYGDIVVQNDKRRAEHNVVQEHFQAALPAEELWQTGCVALRQPKVLQHLVQNGVPQHLLNQFQPGMALLEKLRDASPMADTDGQPMTPEAIQDWERKTQFDERRGRAADGWASASQVSADIQSAVAQPNTQVQQMDQDVEDSQVL